MVCGLIVLCVVLGFFVEVCIECFSMLYVLLLCCDNIDGIWLMWCMFDVCFGMLLVGNGFMLEVWLEDMIFVCLLVCIVWYGWCSYIMLGSVEGYVLLC